MESGVDFPSPESTVTSLLSSSGHLRSSLLAPEHNTTFRYRDKIYDSASAALDAYITDFERSRRNSGSLTGNLVLPHSPPSTPSRPRASALRNKDVLRERLTERELDFLNLPVSSLHHRGNRDRLSMTTDELLSIPHDGSMPVTHTSAFIHGLLSQSGASRPFSSSSRPAHRTWDRPSSSHAAPHLNHHHPHPTRTPRSSRARERPGTVMFNPDVDISSVSYYRQSAHRAARSEWAEPSSSLHLPRWFTSNKSDMDCSGITSVPDLEYPAWVQRCDLSEPPPPSESEPWDDHGTTPPARHQHCQAPRTPSWVAELEDDDPGHKPKQVDSQQTLRDLRLQFAEQISLLAAERNPSDIMETLFRDNRIESLIQKADQVLNSLSQSSGEADPGSPADCVEEAVSPANTEELLLCSSSHCRPFTRDFATAAAGGGITEALTDIKAQRPESEAELESFPGGPSLQRAMHHLSRLKVLVEEREKKHTEKEEEKDEDEGRYSSSSAEGLNCTRQSPT
ncbi:lung adenoma susceptibility protein 2 isoform X5 [Sander vitreus]